MNKRAQPPIPAWTVVPGYTDIIYSKAEEGIAKITINRPEVRNAFRPETVKEMQRAFDDARDDDHDQRRDERGEVAHRGRARFSHAPGRAGKT